MVHCLYKLASIKLETHPNTHKSRNLVPPKQANDDETQSTRKITENNSNESLDYDTDEDDFSFIETFLKTAKQDPERSQPKIDPIDNELLDAGFISDVFNFDDDENGGNNNGDNISVEKIIITTQQKKGLETLGKGSLE